MELEKAMKDLTQQLTTILSNPPTSMDDAAPDPLLDVSRRYYANNVSVRVLCWDSLGDHVLDLFQIRGPHVFQIMFHIMFQIHVSDDVSDRCGWVVFQMLCQMHVSDDSPN